jgi:TonB family protein
MNAHIATYTLPSLKTTLAWSASMHAALLVTLILGNFHTHGGDPWGGPGGGAMRVGLVGNLAGVPLPRPEAQTPSRVVDETRGLHKAEPPKREPETAAKQIPEFERNKPPRYVTRPSRVLENDTAPPEGAIPYGQGGAPSLPYTQFTMGGATAGGLGLSGPGGGDFGARFPTYVEAVRRRISSNWLQSAIEPSVRWAPRVVMTFQILRDGTITNIERVRSSGIDSVDRSALRALLDSNPLAPLPAEYNGSFVTVEFWFDFRR